MSPPTTCGSPRRGARAASRAALDVRQAEQLLFTATGQIASLEREIAQAENALSLLLGQVPGDVPRGPPLEAFQAPPTVPAGLPSALLERRPDIRQAEQQLIAANAQIGAAKAEYFPRISLTGVLRRAEPCAVRPAERPGRAGERRRWAPRRRSSTRAARAQRAARRSGAARAVVNYQRVIYTALRDVADSLAGVREDERAAHRSRNGWSKRCATSARLSTQRYQGGLDSYLPVLDAQRNLFRGRAGARAAAPAGAGVDRAAVSRARRRMVSRSEDRR